MPSKYTNTGGERTTSWTAQQIVSKELGEVEWLIEDILPQGFFFIAGKPKMKKSFMALQMSLAIVGNGKFLGYQVREPGRVLYISLEDNARRLKKRMLNMGIHNDTKGIDLLEIEETWRKLNKGGLEDLLKRLKSKRYTLCLMDTYAKSFLLRDNNDAVEATKYLSPIYELTRGGQFSFGFIDHHRKNNQFSGDVIDDLSGSGAKAGVADTIWGLSGERGKNTAQLKIASRDTEVDHLDLVFDHDRTLWVPQEFEIVRPNTVQAKILAYFGTNGKDTYISKLSKVLSYDESLIHREMMELQKKGLVRKGEKVGRNVPYSLTKRV